MSYNCEILADSLSPQGERLTTFKLTYPRIVHAELMTHRMFSRNAASSRAVPVKKMIESVRNNMFTPLAIQNAHKGMQGSDYFEGIELEQANRLWVESAELALQQAEKMEKFGITKQIINRILEPYQYYQVLVTATEWNNFFELRCPQYEIKRKINNEPEEIFYFKSKKNFKKFFKEGFDNNKKYFPIVDNMTDLEWLKINKSQADIHIQAIAELMYDAYNETIPKQLQAGEWHIPFGGNIDIVRLEHMTSDFNKSWVRQHDTKAIEDLKIKIVTARCARISYETLGDNPKVDYEADIKLHDMLLESKHFSTFEHCARAMSDTEYNTYINGKVFVDIDAGNPEARITYDENAFGWCRNFKGFIQYRHLID